MAPDGPLETGSEMLGLLGHGQAKILAFLRRMPVAAYLAALFLRPLQEMSGQQLGHPPIERLSPRDIAIG
jgi:hypothetical protein